MPHYVDFTGRLVSGRQYLLACRIEVILVETYKGLFRFHEPSSDMFFKMAERSSSFQHVEAPVRWTQNGRIILRGFSDAIPRGKDDWVHDFDVLYELAPTYNEAINMTEHIE